MTHFTKLPQDMLQWEISQYLSAGDRANFNQVVRPDERVYKKFDEDLAIRHHITVMHNKYVSIMLRIRIASDTLAEGGFLVDERAKRQGVEGLKDLFAFLSGEGRVLVQYMKNAKKQLIIVLNTFTVDDTDIYDVCSRFQTNTLRHDAEETIAKLNEVEFIRPVKNIKKYRRTLGMD